MSAESSIERSVMADGSIAAALTGDEARELAKRWAWWQGEAERRDPHKLFPALDDTDRERLFAWVRERMESKRLRWVALGQASLLDEWEFADCIAVELRGDFVDDEAPTPQAHALCEAAGWPS